MAQNYPQQRHTRLQQHTAIQNPSVTTLVGDELRPLLGSNTDSSIPLWLDERRWVRWPAYAVHIIWETISSRENLALFFLRIMRLWGDTYLNILLAFVPFGIIGGALEWNHKIVFAFNFVAIVPLEDLLNTLAEKLCLSFPQNVGTVLTVLLPHICPLILGIIAVIYGEIRLAQAFMIGSIISNIMLGLGGCFLLSGIRYTEEAFETTAASTMAGLLLVIATPFAICKMMSMTLTYNPHGLQEPILILSHYVAIFLLILYFLWLYFKLRSHAYLWDQEEPSNEDEGSGYGDAPGFRPKYALALVVVLALIIVSSRYLVKSVDGLVTSSYINKTFTGLILLPIMTNTSNYIKTFVIAYGARMDLAVALTLGTSVDIAFATLPILVLVGWVIGQPMVLEFQLLETIILVVAVLLMAGLVRDGKSNFLEGAMCLGLYIIITLAYIVYPDDSKGL